jgi:hypothetical protein
MDEPSGGARDGGQVSAPVFREIAEAILPEMNIVPDANVIQNTLTAEEIPEEVDDPTNASPLPPETEDAVADQKMATQKIAAKMIKENTKSAKTEKTKETKVTLKETLKDNKKDSKQSGDEKKQPKPKAAALSPESKNKSSTEKKKQKT